MPSDPDQDYDEGQALMAEDALYWSRRGDYYEDWCAECDKFGEDCKCQREENE